MSAKVVKIVKFAELFYKQAQEAAKTYSGEPGGDVGLPWSDEYKTQYSNELKNLNKGEFDSNAEVIKKVQEALNDSNPYMDLKVDGFLGQETLDAIKFWQRLIQSHKVYVVANGEVLQQATPEKFHKYWSDEEGSPQSQFQLLLVK